MIKQLGIIARSQLFKLAQQGKLSIIKMGFPKINFQRSHWENLGIFYILFTVSTIEHIEHKNHKTWANISEI